jgi:hypothetical protein
MLADNKFRAAIVPTISIKVAMEEDSIMMVVALTVHPH